MYTTESMVLNEQNHKNFKQHCKGRKPLNSF